MFMASRIKFTNYAFGKKVYQLSKLFHPFEVNGAPTLLAGSTR